MARFSSIYLSCKDPRRQCLVQFTLSLTVDDFELDAQSALAHKDWMTRRSPIYSKLEHAVSFAAFGARGFGEPPPRFCKETLYSFICYQDNIALFS
jgi:hypothetical protein